MTPPPDPVGAALSSTDADALLVEAGRGDLHAFADLYDRSAPLVFGMLRGVLGHTGPAERATHDVYLQLWRAAPAFDPGARSAYATMLHIARRALTGPDGGRPAR